MLHSQQTAAPAQTSLQRAHDEPTDLKSQSSSAQLSLFWPTSDLSALSCYSFDVDSKPKTGSSLFTESDPGADLLQLGLSSLLPNHSIPSGPPSATTTRGLDTKAFASAHSFGCESSRTMSASSNYHFETPSLHQVSALTAPFSTSSPTVHSVGTAAENSAQTSPSQHEQGWGHNNSHDSKMGVHSPTEPTHTFQAPYAPRSASAANAYQGHQAHSAHYHDHEYSGFGSHPGLPQYLQHRASISGPSMDSGSYAERYESSAAAPAPPRVHGLAAWENASGSARPHTADGMFGQFGMVSGASATPQESPSDTAALGSAAGYGSRPSTSGAYAANVDPYYASRRMSMPDPSSGPGGSKVFSYMVPGEDGGMMSSSSSMNLGSQGFNSHYFGNGYHAGGSKKRPRRRYDEIERLYPCSWPGCTKSYGTLNHLNAHVAMQKHGPKRSPSEFKDMRKAWRKQKKEDEQRRQSRQVSSSEQSIRPSFSGSSYASMPSSEFASSASAIPLAGPPSLSGFGSSGTSLPGMAQMPSSLANLNRYSMSAGTTAAQQQQSFYLNNGSTDSGLHGGASHHAAPLQYASGDVGNDSSRMPYASSNTGGGNNAHYPNLGAYLSAHRGSV